MAKGQKAGNINAIEAASGKRMSDDTMADWKKKQAGGVTVKECEETLARMNDQLGKVKGMAAKK